MPISEPIQDERSIDRFHEEGDQLYRVMRNYYADDQVYTWSAIPTDPSSPQVPHLRLTG